MRIRGGTNGLLSAIDAGLIDPENAALPEEPRECGRLSGADLRRNIKRDADRAKRREKSRKKRDAAPF